MRGSEFLRKIQALSKTRGWSFEWHPNQGKGSHGILYVNGRLTVLRHLPDELKPGTLRAMLRQLDISPADFWQGR